MLCSLARTRRTLAAVGAAVSASGLCHADDRSWNNPVGGVFSAPANWLGGVPPGPGDRALFPIAGSYSVTLTSDAHIASFLASSGVITASLAGSLLDCSDQLFVAEQDGESASVTFAGGMIATPFLEAGRWFGSNGTLTLDAVDATVTTDTVIGREGTGVAVLRNGTEFTQAGGTVWVGFNNFAKNPCSGTLTIDASSVYAMYDLNAGFGRDCTAAVSITSGSQVSAIASVFGVGTGTTATLDVRDAGTLFQTRKNQLIFGAEQGTGSLSLTDGGAIDALFCWIGAGDASHGSAVMRGKGTTFQTHREFVVGLSGGQGSLLVEDGVDFRPRTFGVAWDNNAQGTATIRGSTVTVDENAALAFTSTASLTLEDASTLTCRVLELGHGGDATLVVRGGSTLTSLGMAAGYRDTGSATVSISDPGTVVTGVGTIGSSRPVTMTVQDGALLLSGPNPPVFSWNDYIGISSISEVTITGAGTRWDNINGLWVGGIYFDTPEPGHGTLRVLDGAGVSGRQIFVGAGANAVDTGTLLVDASSRCDARFGFVVGRPDAPAGSSVIDLRGGTLGGRVTTTPGGTFLASGQIVLPDTPPTGLLLVGNGGLWDIGETPGTHVGHLEVRGDGQSNAGTRVRMNVEQSGHDSVAFQGSFACGGTLELSFDGFDPADGDSWDLITAASVTGRFGDIVGDGAIGDGRFIVVEHGATTVRASCVVVTGLSVTPSSTRVTAGFLAGAQAVASTPSGPVVFTTAATWSSDDPGIAMIEGPGIVRGMTPGTTTVRATAGEFQASMLVNVDPFPVNPAVERISVADTEDQLTRASFSPSISGNGRFVAFHTDAPGVVPGDTGAPPDVFVRDTATGATLLVSQTPAGLPGNASSAEGELARSGRFVAFYSAASDLVAGDTNNRTDMFVRDLQSGTTERISVATDGTQGDNDSFISAISADGSRVAFFSYASNLVPGDTNGLPDVFLRDRSTGQTTRLSISADGTVSGASVSSMSISDDGRFVVFESNSALVPADTNNTTDLYLRDLTLGTIERVSVGTGGVQGNSSSLGFGRIVSNDGRWVIFQSNATNLIPADSNNARDAFLRDRLSGTTVLVNALPDGSPTAGGVGSVSLSADGRVAAWRSPGANVVSGDTNGLNDVFAKDLVTGNTRRVSVGLTGEQGDGASSFIDITSDGRAVVFESSSTNFAPFDTNAVNDIFRRRVSIPICPADVNDSGQVNSQDFFDFLTAFFAGSASADFNHNGQVNSQDFFDFLGAFFTAC
jgi:T5SS/PEP-CTERM-associated repeat protein